jgi:hypothetical protein
MKILKSRGPRTDPCGTPDNTSKGDEIVSPIRTIIIIIIIIIMTAYSWITIKKH